MNLVIESYTEAGLRRGEVIWPKTADEGRRIEQQRQLLELVDMSKSGVILDCSLVEIGNSELLNVLMRVRNHAKKHGKHIVLYNVPKTVEELIRLCNLRSTLKTAKDDDAATKILRSLSGGGAAASVASNSTAIIAATGAGILLVLGLLGYMLIR